MNKLHDLSVTSYGIAKAHNYAMAILPWGATEPHNYHLPYITDAILSHAIAVDAAEKAEKKYGINAMVLPPITLGAQNPGQRQLKFCIHTRQETQKAILTDIVASLRYQGIETLLIINGHGGNIFKGMIRDLAVDFPEMTVATSEWYRVLPAKDFFDCPGDHADELETSVMMYYHPELVDLSGAGTGRSGSFAAETLRNGVAWIPRDWSCVSEDTGIGNPNMSTAAKGERFAKAVTDVYADLIRDLTLPKQERYKF